MQVADCQRIRKSSIITTAMSVMYGPMAAVIATAVVLKEEATPLSGFFLRPIGLPPRIRQSQPIFRSQHPNLPNNPNAIGEGATGPKTVIQETVEENQERQEKITSE